MSASSKLICAEIDQLLRPCSFPVALAKAYLLLGKVRDLPPPTLNILDDRPAATASIESIAHENGAKLVRSKLPHIIAIEDVVNLLLQRVNRSVVLCGPLKKLAWISSVREEQRKRTGDLALHFFENSSVLLSQLGLPLLSRFVLRDGLLKVSHRLTNKIDSVLAIL